MNRQPEMARVARRDPPKQLSAIGRWVYWIYAVLTPAFIDQRGLKNSPDIARGYWRMSIIKQWHQMDCERLHGGET